MPETERWKAAEFFKSGGNGFESSGQEHEPAFSCSFDYMCESAETYADEFYDSALLEAAGLVCQYCRLGDVPYKQFGNFVHTGAVHCDAGPIHERRAQK